MTDLFLKRKVVNYNSLLEMKEDTSCKFKDAEVLVTKPIQKSVLMPKSRSTTLKEGIKIDQYPDICADLIDFVDDWPDPRIKEECRVGEFNYLIYNNGDHFKVHVDRIGQKIPRRIYSTSTLISQSADFEGGELIIYDRHGNGIDTDLKVGETVFFHATTPHQVNPVTKGTREVLVAWIFDKFDT